MVYQGTSQRPGQAAGWSLTFNKKKSLPEGASLAALLDLAVGISREDCEKMRAAIEEGCERIDPDPPELDFFFRELKPEVEAGLLAQAQANGITLEEYVLSMVEGAALSATQKSLPPDERAAAFETWAASHRPTPDLSDYAVSRESIYEGHDH